MAQPTKQPNRILCIFKSALFSLVLLLFSIYTAQAALKARPNVPGHLTFVHPTASTRVGSPFGFRYHPTKHRRILHSGVDFSGKRGEKVVASTGGRVIFSGRNGAYGLMIDIDAGNGIVLRYAHLDKLAVKKSTIVRQGQYIGKIGRTGRVTAPHLHFEVRVHNKPVNPLKYLDRNRTWATNTKSSRTPTTR